MKKLLLLGGLRYLVPVIEKAHKLGYYVITCDYLPNNIAHRYSDEYHNRDITNHDSVLQLAEGLNIDGIMSFAVDPGVTTAAFVCEKLRLPSPGPYKSVRILQNKKLFRKFLADNTFNVPNANGYADVQSAMADINKYNWPIIVKPVDSAGSKGVSKVCNKTDLLSKIQYALHYSNSKQFIIEEYIEQKDYASDSESFSIDGKLVFFSLSNQRFDANAANPFTPAGFSWPSSISIDKQEELKNEIQRLLGLLNMGTSIYNIEARLGLDNKAYIMEVSPRGGGNRLAEMIELATGTDLISLAIQSAVGEKILHPNEANYTGHWGEIILHSNVEGHFIKLEIDKMIHPFIYNIDLWIREGGYIKPFTGANETIGTIFIKCDNQNQLEDIITNHSRYIKIIVG